MSNCCDVKDLTQTVGLLPISVALTVVAVAGVTGAHHSTKVISTLLLTGGAGTYIIVYMTGNKKVMSMLV